MEILSAPGQAWRQSYLPFVVLVLVLNLVSAVLFIALVKHPVYDHVYNIYDVHNYATRGFSQATLSAQRNAPGPTSFVWMGLAVRLLGGNELRAARLGALASWALLGLGVLLGAHTGGDPRPWYASLLTLLVFPHAVTATATILTEGPALLFAVMGALVWTVSVSTQGEGKSVLELLGALSLGLAVTCRQYNLALFIAAIGLVLYLHLGQKRELGLPWMIHRFMLLACGAVPVLLLILAWRGVSSPGIASGTSYNMAYRAGAGLNLTRPIIAALDVAIYLVPLTFPLMLRLKSGQRWWALLAAVLSGMACGYSVDSLLQPGPVHSAVLAMSKAHRVDEVLFGLLVAVSIYNAVALCLKLWEQRGLVTSLPVLAFALLIVLFFIGEQFGVGGNIPFYDRYVLQVAPFLGIIAFAMLPVLSNMRLLALAAMSVVSHVMVWRFLFNC
ncbi:MAG: hypothetical protein AUH86_24715 [Acidobacteria bacterium 13_1_40CM_4_58_4]|nr:MAG: hypothetical protein AUH86_24715 [Acidobacteria bacterium 13_1_40CM_4_58_4]